MPYYQRMGKIDRRSMVYGTGRLSPSPYRNYRGVSIFTDIFEIGQGDPGVASLHGKIYDPSELGVEPPYPEFVEIDEVWYQFNPNDRPPTRNHPFSPNDRTYSNPRTVSGIPQDRQTVDKYDDMKLRSMHGVGHNQIFYGVNPGIYREKNQEEDNYESNNQPVYEQSSILSQQIRRDVVKGDRLLDSVNMSTGEIEKGGERAYIGELPENIQGNKNTFFINPANRPKEGDHKDLD